jgi:WD40 repeat protein
MMSRPQILLRARLLLLLALALPAAGQERPQLMIQAVGTGLGADIDVSPDGKWYVTTNGQDVTIWSTANGMEFRTFHVGVYGNDVAGGPTGTISVSPDGQTIAAANREEVRLFDVKTAKLVASIPIGDDVVRIAYHPTRMMLAVLGAKGTLTIYDARGNRPVFQKSVEPKSFILRFSADGKLLAAGSQDAVHVFAWEHDKEVAHFDARATDTQDIHRKLQSMVISPSAPAGLQMQTAEQLGLYHFVDVAFSPDSSKIALLHQDEVSLTSPSSKRAPDAIPMEHNNALTCIFSTGDSLIVGRFADAATQIDLATRGQKEYPAWGAKRFVLIPGSQILLIGFDNGVGMETIDGTGLRNLFSSSKLASSDWFRFSPDGKELLTGGQGMAPMSVWNLESGEADDSLIPLKNVFSFAISSDGTLIACYGSEGYPNEKVHVWNRRTQKEELSLPITVEGSPTVIDFSPDGSKLAAFIGEPKAIRIWSIPSGEVLGDVPVTAIGIVDLAWSPDSRSLAVSNASGVMLVDAPPGGKPSVARTINPLPWKTPLPMAQKPEDMFGHVRFSPDGKLLAVQENTSIALVDTASWSLKGSIPNASVGAFDFSPDGKRMIYSEQVNNPEKLFGGSRIAFWDLDANAKIPGGSDESGASIVSQTRDGSLFAGAANGGIGIFSGATGQLLATLYRSYLGKTADWLVVAPDGLFDGTPGAWNQLSWRFSGDTFDVAPVEIFFQSFYHPGLLAEIASGHVPKAPADIADVDRRQPAATLTSTTTGSTPVVSRTVHLDLTVSEAPPDAKHASGSGARDLRLFRNGTLVEA